MSRRRRVRPLSTAAAAIAVAAGLCAPSALAQDPAPAPDAPEVRSAVEDLSRPASPPRSAAGTRPAPSSPRTPPATPSTGRPPRSLHGRAR